MNPCRNALAVLVLLLAAVSPAFAADPPAAEPPADDSVLEDGPLFTPAPQPAAPPCAACAGGFTTSPGGGAASHWGFGSDCASAQNDIRSQLLADTLAECQSIDGLGRCGFQVVYTNACFFNGSQYQSDGYANFACWISIC